MATANVQIKKILVGRGNTAVASNYSGVRGEITMDTDLKALRIHDGVQVGGYVMAGQDWVEQYVANAALGGIDTSVFATTANLAIIDANVGAFQTYANLTFGTSTYGNANVASYLLDNPQGGVYSNANVAAYLLENPQGSTYSNANVASYLLANPQGSTYSNSNVSAYLVANPQAGTYSNTNVQAYLGANVGAFQLYSNANVGTITVSLSNLDANVGAYETWANAFFSTVTNAAAAATNTNNLRANVTAANTAINNVNANIGAFQTYANATFSTVANAGTQQTAINSIDANIGAFQTYANLHFSDTTYGNVQMLANLATATVVTNLQSNISAANTRIVSLESNVGAYESYANLTFSTVANAGTQQTAINNLNSNIGAFQTYSNSNVGAIKTSLTNLDANVGAFQPYANLTFSTVANAGTQQTAINNLNSNIGAYQIYANANVGTISTTLTNLHANVGAYESYANLTFSTVANAGTQQTQIDGLRSNITAANSAISTLQGQVYSNTNVAAYLAGNVIVGNLTVNDNAVILGNLRVAGTQTTVNTATLNVTDLFITVANAATQPSDANGAGLRVAGALANIKYMSTSDYWDFNKPITANIRQTSNVSFADGTFMTTSWVANAGTQQTEIDNFNANLGAYQTYANSTFVTGTPWTGAGYLTTEADTLDSVTTRGSTTTNDITVGNITLPFGGKLGDVFTDGYGLGMFGAGLQAPPGGSYVALASNSLLNYLAVDDTHIVLHNNSSTWDFGGDGNLTVPGSILPAIDNTQDLGSATQRFRHLYVGPGTVYIGNAAIKSTTAGNLILPGVTRAVAASAYAEEVQDTGDQSHSFSTTPTIIDNAQYSDLTGRVTGLSFTPAEYSVDQLDGEGFIDGITIDAPGSGYAGDVAELAQQNMWATETADPLNNFVGSDWIQIPFRVQSRAGESEYDFSTATDRLTSEGHSAVMGTDGTLTTSGNLAVTGGTVAFNTIKSGFARNNVAVDSVDNYGLYITKEAYPDAGTELQVGYTATDSSNASNTDTIDSISDQGEFWFILTGQTWSADRVNFTGATASWQFGTDGNLTLPGGQLIGGSDSTQGITMTTDRGTVLFGNQPEQCEPLTLSSHFHIMKQDPGLVDLFFGDDFNYVKLPGNGDTAYGVEIGTNVGSAYTWRFGTDGNLTLPNGSSIGDKTGISSHGPAVDTANINSVIGTFPGLDFSSPNGVAVGWLVNGPGVTNATILGIDAGNGFIEIDGGAFQVDQSYTFTGTSSPISIGTKITVNSNDWTFGTDGNLTLPTDGNINYANGVNILSTVGSGSVVSSDVAPQAPTEGELWYDQVSGRLYVWYDDTWVDASIGGVNGGADLGKFKIVDAGSAVGWTTTDDADGYGGYNMFLSPDGEGHSYITIPNNAEAATGESLRIGGTGANSAVVIETYNGNWTFANLGNLIAPWGYLTIDSGYESGLVGMVAKGTEMSTRMLYSSGNVASAITLKQPNVPTVEYPPTVNISLYDDSSTPTATTWTFGLDGNLTFPSGMTIFGNTDGTQGIIATGNSIVGVVSSGLSGASALEWVDDFTSPTVVSAVVVNSPYATGAGAVQISTGATNPFPEHNWFFESDGNLTLPLNGNINYANGVNILSTVVSGGTWNGGQVGASIYPSANISYDLGATTAFWSNIYSASVTVAGNVTLYNPSGPGGSSYLNTQHIKLSGNVLTDLKLGQFNGPGSPVWGNLSLGGNINAGSYGSGGYINASGLTINHGNVNITGDQYSGVLTTAGNLTVNGSVATFDGSSGSSPTTITTSGMNTGISTHGNVTLIDGFMGASAYLNTTHMTMRGNVLTDLKLGQFNGPGSPVWGNLSLGGNINAGSYGYGGSINAFELILNNSQYGAGNIFSACGSITMGGNITTTYGSATFGSSTSAPTSITTTGSTPGITTTGNVTLVTPGGMGGSSYLNTQHLTLRGNVLTDLNLGVSNGPMSPVWGNLNLGGNINAGSYGSGGYINATTLTVTGNITTTGCTSVISSGGNISSGTGATFGTSGSAPTTITTSGSSPGITTTGNVTLVTPGGMGGSSYLNAQHIKLSGNILTDLNLGVSNGPMSPVWGNLNLGGNINAGSYGSGGVISATQYNFANGINILTTVSGGAGTYSNSNVASYLTANPPAGTYSNSNVASYLVANPQAGTYSNSNVSSYLTANPPAGTYSNSNVASYLAASTVTTGVFQSKQIRETFGNVTPAGNAFALDCSAGQIFNVIMTNISANFTANLTNLSLATGYVTTVSMVLNQGSTGYVPSVLKIADTTTAFTWQGSSTPVGVANKKDVVAFNILNAGGSYIVLAQLVSF